MLASSLQRNSPFSYYEVDYKLTQTMQSNIRLQAV